MQSGILEALGGVGLLLVALHLMTEGLRELAGGALRRNLARFTATPLSGAVAGAAATALVRSSSAVTVATVGFVGAGLMTFPQALGVIFGANVGTTVTGWVVALLGFKLQIGALVGPLALAGALMRLIGRGRWRPGGAALAGFALLFVAVDLMQSGLAGLEGAVTPDDLPAGGPWALLQLVAIGAAATLVTQSSSAGVAAALVGLQAGALSFPQAAAMVIGMDLGTTATALLATIGGGTDMRRTGAAHVVFNVLTAIVGVALLTAVAPAIEARLVGAGPGDAQIALVAFHSAFNLLGVALILPFAAPFARLVVWMIRDGGDAPTRRLDDRLLSEPESALEAALATLRDIAGRLFARTSRLAARDRRPGRTERHAEALRITAAFLDRIPSDRLDAEDGARLLAAFHALDHLGRLANRCDGAEARPDDLDRAARDPRLGRLLRTLGAVAEDLAERPDAASRADRLRRLLRGQRESVRARAVDALATDRASPEAAMASMDLIRWMHRVAYHLWRISAHLETAAEPRGDPPPDAPPASGALDEEAPFR